MNILDEYSRECLAIRVKRKLSSVDVIDALTDLFILRGVPAYIRSDNGPEFIAEAVQRRIKAVGARTAYIEPGSPWENGYIESFNARFSGTAQTVFLPMSAIIAIYARENGQGMMFPSEEDVMADDSDPKSKSEKNDIPHLRVIK